MLRAGTVIQPAEIAMLAAVGCFEVSVYRRPSVAVFSTGDELAEDQVPPLDFTLDETKRILVDFINLSGMPNLLAVTQSAATK